MTKFDAVRFPRFALIVITALVLLAAVIASGCGASGESASASEIAERKVKVTTTTNFITDTVRQIGGDRVEVSGLMGPGVDPHLYKASAGDVKTLREADVIIYGGLQLEGKMADLLDELEERQTTVAITKDIPRETLLEPPAQVAEQYDPHQRRLLGNFPQAFSHIGLVNTVRYLSVLPGSLCSLRQVNRPDWKPQDASSSSRRADGD